MVIPPPRHPDTVVKAEYQSWSKHNSHMQRKKDNDDPKWHPDWFHKGKEPLLCLHMSVPSSNLNYNPAPSWRKTLFSGKHQSYCLFWRAKQSRFMLCVCGQPDLGGFPRSVCAESASVRLSICLNTTKTQSDTESCCDKYGQISADLSCHRHPPPPH